MTRTVRLATLPLNGGKRRELETVVRCFTHVKRDLVKELRPASMWSRLDYKRGFRDLAKAQGWYPKDMNVHLADQAAFDAVDMCVRHIDSCIARANIKGRIWRKFSDEDECHYAYACLARYGRMGEILLGKVPELDTIGLDPDRKTAVARYLHRTLRKAMAGTWPSVEMIRSMVLDETLYTNVIVGQPGGKKRQYIRVVSTTKGKRIALPLAGISRILGNIRIVLDERSNRSANRAFIHVSYDINTLGDATGPDKAIDWGVTEVCTDNHGVKHGTGYGTTLTAMTEQRTKTGKSRGKLHALARAKPGSKREKRIKRNNLGTKKLQRRTKKDRATLRTISGAAVKGVVYGSGNRTRARGKVARSPEQRPRRLAVEDLSRLSGKSYSKKMSRLHSTWMRAENEERITVHTHVGGSEVETVNAVYTSQTCPDPACGYVSRDNRRGDRFHCRNPYWDCNWQGDADHVAAINVLARIDDPDISRFTPTHEVEKILLGRFQRRLESRGRNTEATAHGRTSSKPRRTKDVGAGIASDSQSPVHMDGTGETQRLKSENKRST
jgi:transposase